MESFQVYESTAACALESHTIYFSQKFLKQDFFLKSLQQLSKRNLLG